MGRTDHGENRSAVAREQGKSISLLMPLCDAEREIAKVVVHRFLTGKESTSKRLLVTRFRSPRALQRLVDLAILKRVGQTGEDFLRDLWHSTTAGTRSMNDSPGYQ